MMEKKIALLFFSRNATLEGCRKAWFSAGSREKNRRLAASFIHHTHRTLQRTDLPVFHYHEGNQSGETFGEKLANAFQEIFQQGYHGVIAVGNDTPGIDRVDWQQLSDQLMSGRCIIGPNFRRGAYLIGITAEVFDRERFQQLPWQSARLLEALVAFCRKSDQTPLLLHKLRDANTADDLKQLVRELLLSSRLKKTLLLLLSATVQGFLKAIEDFRRQLFLLGRAHFRAPPVILFPFR